MSEEERKALREFVATLVKQLFDEGNFSHLDGYGGALLVLDVEEAMEALYRKGWRVSENRKLMAIKYQGADGEIILSPDDVVFIYE